MKLPPSLRSLARRNVRLFFAGQTVSLVGTWMQSVAQQWLVWRLTGSARFLGAVAFLGQFPVFLFGTLGGSLADRVPRRRVVMVTQALAALQALALAVLTLGGWVRPWHVLLLATLLGLVAAVDIPARQALLADLGGEDLGNTIALNSSVVNGARMVGPAIAGWLLAALGEGLCFLGNALSYVAILVGLSRMELDERRSPRPPPGHLRAGIAYGLATPHVRALLGLTAAGSLFGLAFTTLMPLYATEILHGDARLLGILFAAVGLGALGGAVLLLRHRGVAGLGRRAAWGSTLFAVGVVLFARSRWPLVSTLALVLVGFGFMTQFAASNTLLQTLAPLELRGRVMGLYSTMFIGMAPIGSLLVGWATPALGASATVTCSGAALLAASLAFHLALPSLRAGVIARFPERFGEEQSQS